MLYNIIEVFQGVQRVGDEAEESHRWEFQIADEVDPAYPAVVFIRATGVDYRKDRVELNDNFVGYLKPGQACHLFQVDNRVHGLLQKGDNHLTVLTTDVWGDRKSVNNQNIDDIRVTHIDVAYKAA